VTGVVASPENKFLSQPKKPFSATGAVGVRAASGARGWAAITGLAAAGGFGTAIGAGMSGSTPLMIGSCLLCFSWLRRVTKVGSSISSAIL
jgi:hypothetical protein